MDNVVLVADPKPERLEKLLDALDAAGLRCLAAGNGSEALAVAARYKPQLVIVRTELPDVQGTDVCLRLKQEDSIGRPAAILITGRASQEEEFVAKEVGADMYLSEPLTNEELVENARALFRHERLNAGARGLRSEEPSAAPRTEDS